MTYFDVFDFNDVVEAVESTGAYDVPFNQLVYISLCLMFDIGCLCGYGKDTHAFVPVGGGRFIVNRVDQYWS